MRYVFHILTMIGITIMIVIFAKQTMKTFGDFSYKKAVHRHEQVAYEEVYYTHYLCMAKQYKERDAEAKIKVYLDSIMSQEVALYTEIMNFPEKYTEYKEFAQCIRKQLEVVRKIKNRNFKGITDSESIIRMYNEGTDSINKVYPEFSINKRRERIRIERGE